MTHIGVIITIIISAALLGGLTNFLIVFKSTDATEEKWVNFFKSILVSLCAASTVPLFLQIISNNLLDVLPNSIYPDKNYFILAGFCVLAAFFSKRFLEDLYEKVNRAEQKADQAKQQVENLENKNQEVDNETINEKIVDIKTFKTKHTQEDIKTVVGAIIRSKYSWRTESGIVESTGFDKAKVEDILNLLLSAGLAESRIGMSGKTLWKITAK